LIFVDCLSCFGETLEGNVASLRMRN